MLTLRDLPFRRGDAVEVIVLSSRSPRAAPARYPLRGVPVTLRLPTEPAADVDWETVG